MARDRARFDLTMTLVIVKAGLAPAIHVFDLAPDSRRGCPAQGNTRPGMTKESHDACYYTLLIASSREL
jgi:hypothetical protein